MENFWSRKDAAMLDFRADRTSGSGDENWRPQGHSPVGPWGAAYMSRPYWKGGIHRHCVYMYMHTSYINTRTAKVRRRSVASRFTTNVSRLVTLLPSDSLLSPYTDSIADARDQVHLVNSQGFFVFFSLPFSSFLHIELSRRL